MTTVIHVKDMAPGDVRIDRRTEWGNPFVMRSERERTDVIARYRDHLWKRIRSEPELICKLADLRGKRLACHCAPRPCHGDVLANAAEWAARRFDDHPF